MHITYLSRNQSSCLEFRPEKNFHEELFYHCHCLDLRADGDYKKQATFQMALLLFLNSWQRMHPLLPAQTGLFPLPCHLQPPPPKSARDGDWRTGETWVRLLCTAAGLLPGKQNFLQVSAPRETGPHSGEYTD